MNDDFLYKFRKSPRREFAAALYQRISKPMHTNSRTSILRYATVVVSAVAVIAAVLFFSPATRAFADSFIRQVGGYIFVQATPQPHVDDKDVAGKKAPLTPEQKAKLVAYKQQLNEQMKKQEQAGDKENATYAADAAAASQLTGFTVLAPSYVPAGFTVGDVRNVSGGWAVMHNWGGVAALLDFDNKATDGFFVVEELKYQDDQPKTVERPEIQDVTVRGQPGVWMPDAGGKSTLVWEENGIMFTIATNTVPLEELLKVAESLGN